MLACDGFFDGAPVRIRSDGAEDRQSVFAGGVGVEELVVHVGGDGGGRRSVVSPGLDDGLHPGLGPELREGKRMKGEEVTQRERGAMGMGR